VSPTRRNLLASDVIVVPVSGVLRPMVWHVRLKRGEGGLARESMAKCEQVTTIPRHAIEPTPLGAPLSEDRMREIGRAIQSAVGIVLPEPEEAPTAPTGARGR